MADFLLWAAFLLFVASVLLLFIKFWWALLALFLAIIAYTLYIKTPKGKREQEKLQAQIREKERQAELARQAEAEEIKEIKSLINSLMGVAALNQVALEGFTNKLIFSVL